MNKSLKRIKKVSKYIFCFLFILSLSFGSVLAIDIKDLKDQQFGLKPLARNIGLETDNPLSLAQILGKIIGVALSLLGIIFMLLITYGGFSWMTARGDDEKVKNSKRVIVNAVIGIIVVFSAYALSSVIIDFLYTATEVSA